MRPFSKHLDQQRLVHRIKTYAAKAVEAKQIARRLKELLPMQLSATKRHYRDIKPTSSHETHVSHVSRKALCDENYREKITQSLEMDFLALESRIQYETHLMLYQARQSLNAWHKAVLSRNVNH